MEHRKCKNCNKEFRTYKSRIKVGKGNFCSKKCSNISKIGKPAWNRGKKMPEITGENHPMWGKKHSLETRLKMSLTSKGKPKPWLKGKKFTDEHKRKMSEARRNKYIGKNNWNWKGGKPKCIDCGKQLKSIYAKRCQKCNNSSKEFTENNSKKLKGRKVWNTGIKYIKISKEKHWNWKNGITKENHLLRDSLESKLWRKSVFERDTYTCQKCKIKGNVLVAHHILNFSKWIKLRFEKDNGITLCKGCHKNFHNLNGRKNNTHEQIDEFIKNNQ